MKDQIRKIAINNLNGELITPGDKIIAKKFLNYINVYCCELKVSESDVLYDEEKFDIIWNLYTNVITN